MHEPISPMFIGADGEYSFFHATFKNKVVLELDDILTIRANYDTYITSITAFLHLLEKFHAFYRFQEKDFGNLHIFCSQKKCWTSA